MILRGANIAPISPWPNVLERLHTLRAAGANSVRWSLFRDPTAANNDTPETWRAWLDDQLTLVSQVVPLFTELGLYMILDLHTPPGGEARIWHDSFWQYELIRTWQIIATTCVSQPNIPIYDILNEPLPPQPAQWTALSKVVINAIRAIEPGKAIALQPKGAAANFLAFLSYIPGVTYSFHMYDPASVTYQGIPGYPPFGRAYNANDRRNLRLTMQRVRNFQMGRFRRAPIFMGEFDCVRWAPNGSCYEWMKDVLSYANAFKWHWSFLSWQGEVGAADFWSQEYDTNFGPPLAPACETDRIKLIKRGFADQVL